MDVDLTQLTGWNDAVQKAPAELHREMLVDTRVALMEGVTLAKENAPFRDGDLRGDIRIIEAPHMGAGGYTGTYGTDLEYAAQREYGGTIVPRNAKFLVWEGEDGELVFAKSVFQTGSFFIKRSADQLKGKVVRIYQGGVNRALRGVGS